METKNINFVGEHLGIKEIIKAEDVLAQAFYYWETETSCNETINNLTDWTVEWAFDNVVKVHAKYKDQIAKAHQEITEKQASV